VIEATLADIRFFKPGDSFKLPPPSIKVQVPSPERPLPTFDFGIFTNLPLPPGHKEELSPKHAKFPTEWESEYKVPRLPIPPKTFDFNSSANTRPAQLMEKPLRKPVKKSKVSMKRTPSAKKQAIQHERTASDDSAVAMNKEAEKAPESEINQSESIDVLSAMVDDMNLLPEHESAEPIGTSWMSPLLRSSSSRKNSVKLARKPSRLSRTLSRTLSRSGSTRKAASAEASPERVPTVRRQTEGPRSLTRQLSKKRETIPLEKLIKMSHELADKLDGIEHPGFVEVRPSSSYKYHLPRASETKVEPVPDLRWSKLFTTQEPDAFLNESPFFRMAPKPVPSRSKSVGNVDDEIRKAHPGEEVSLPISQMKIKAVREEFPKMTVEAAPLGDVEVCPTCGNTQSIWGRCGCGSEEKETRRRSSNGSGSGNRLPAPMEQAPPVPRRSTLRRIRKRGMTLRRIRTRVVRALTV